MSTEHRSPAAAARCADMRRTFDEAFARPARDTTETRVDLLAIRVAGDAYALRLSEIAGLHVGLYVARLPGPAAHLLGITAIRGVMAPVYDLAGLLGYPPAASGRWIAMVHASQPVGLAIEHFEAHLRVRDTFVRTREPAPGPAAARHSRDAIHAAGALRPVLQIAALIKSVEEKSHDR